MKKVLNYLLYPETYLEQINKAFEEYGFEVTYVSPKDPDGKERAVEALKDADVVLVGSPLPVPELEASSARWIHIDWVGVESILTKELLKKHIVTNGSGRNSICLAEHVFYLVLHVFLWESGIDLKRMRAKKNSLSLNP